MLLDVQRFLVIEAWPIAHYNMNSFDVQFTSVRHVWMPQLCYGPVKIKQSCLGDMYCSNTIFSCSSFYYMSCKNPSGIGPFTFSTTFTEWYIYIIVNSSYAFHRGRVVLLQITWAIVRPTFTWLAVVVGYFIPVPTGAVVSTFTEVWAHLGAPAIVDGAVHIPRQFFYNISNSSFVSFYHTEHSTLLYL